VKSGRAPGQREARGGGDDPRICEHSAKDSDIFFEVKSAEEMEYNDCFDVIFCNATLQWFKDPEKTIKNCYTALRNGGRMGIQAPAKKDYSQNFIEAVL
jgi:ubiquinone/menaquinone biosynthesis C-methylase UbiE